MRRKKDAVGCGFRTGQMIQEVYLQAQPRDGKCIYKPSLGTGSVFTSPDTGQVCTYKPSHGVGHAKYLILPHLMDPRALAHAQHVDISDAANNTFPTTCMYNRSLNSSWTDVEVTTTYKSGPATLASWKCIYKPRHGPDVCPRCDLEGTALDMLGTAPHGLLSTSSPAKK
jgi:hypothetical protein